MFANHLESCRDVKNVIRRENTCAHGQVCSYQCFLISVFPNFQNLYIKQKKIFIFLPRLHKLSRTSPGSKVNKSEAVNSYSYQGIETDVIIALEEFWGYRTRKAKCTHRTSRVKWIKSPLASVQEWQYAKLKYKPTELQASLA